jgi:hypothetical protein
VCIEFKAIVLDNLNLVPTTPLISAGVEVSSVLITFDSSPDFGALFPKGQFDLRRTRQHRDDNRMQAVFGGRQRPMFFDEVQEIDNGFASISGSVDEREPTDFCES